ATLVLPVPPTRVPVPEPEVELDLNLAAEPDVNRIAAAPTIIGPPEPLAASSGNGASTEARSGISASEGGEPHVKTAMLPFDLGPRRRDRARYVQPENEIETESPDAGSEEDPAATPLERPPLSMLERSGSALW